DLEVEEINLKLAERELSKAQKDEKADYMDVEYSVTQAETALDKAEAELSSAEKELDRSRQLYESGVISKAEYDESLDNEKSKKDTYKLSEMELKIARQALADFDLDRNEKIAKLQGSIDIIKENLKKLQSKVDAATRADMDGRVVKLDIDKEILIYDVDQYVVNLQLSQQEALYIEEGMSAKVKIKGLEEKEYKGKVTEVDDVATDSKVNVKLSIDNADKDLKPGYAVEVKIDLNIKEQAVVVDFESIVQDRDGKKFVYYVKDNVARKVAVTTGIETDYEVEVLEGLIQGDRYVVNPPEDMQEKNSMKIWGWRYESK
ncbi:MAG: efflux RND transporter periplasmic adaptor subunit, partial [Pseudomonadota bacterium]